MAGPRISERYKYVTFPKVADRLGIHPTKLRRQLKDGVFPIPTFINEHGLKFFGAEWLKKARDILANSFEAKQ